jgi:hypothetical protein
MRQYRDSPENAARLAALNRSQAKSRRRSPKSLENLTRWQQSPECAARMAEFNKKFAGSRRELIDAPDPDWCLHHNLSCFDHKANSACRYAS